MVFSIPKLSYAYSALEPVIDAKTMEIHHSKHHQTYVDKLNEAVGKYTFLADRTAESMLKDLGQMPEDVRIAIRNNGGGHVNHSFFWKILSPTKKELKGDLLKDIEKTFGSLQSFKDMFLQVATTRFGSGWAWLVLNKGNLEIYSTANQDSPLMEGKVPILGVDVWEHAYYLKYQNKRADYVKAILDIIDWDYVSGLYKENKK